MMEKWKGLRREKQAAIVLLALLCALMLLPRQEGMTQEEKRIAQMLSQIAGAGRVQVSIYYSEEASSFGGGRECVGAVAVCEGAGDIAVRLRLAQALETLLGLSAQAVMVVEMEGAK